MFWRYTSDGHRDYFKLLLYYFACSSEMIPSTTQQNAEHTWIMLMLTLTQKPLILKGNLHTLAIQTFMVKTVRFSFWKNGILCSSHIITIRKTSTVNELNKPANVCGGKQSKLKIDTNLPYTRVPRLTGYIYQSSSCLRIMRVTELGNIPEFQDWSCKGNNGSAEVHSTTWITIQ